MSYDLAWSPSHQRREVTSKSCVTGPTFATGGGLVTSASEFHAEKMTVSDSFAISDASGEGTLDNAGPHGWRVIVFNPLPQKPSKASTSRHLSCARVPLA